MVRKFLGISYNAPLTLSFSLICIIIFILDNTSLPGLILAVFSASGSQASSVAFDWTQPVEYLRLFVHVLGHANWQDLAGSLVFILLLGPVVEERYGSLILLLMFVVTAFVTGILNAVFLDTSLLGASGIAFMMILLATFGTAHSNGMPLSFILVLILYVGSEISTAFVSGSIANFAHLAGGLCGSLFAFVDLSEKRKRRTKKRTTTTAKRKTPTKSTSTKRPSSAKPASAKPTPPTQSPDEDITIVENSRF